MKIIKPKGKYKDYKIRRYANGECELYFKNEYLSKYENETICRKRMCLNIPTSSIPLIQDENIIAHLKIKITEYELEIKRIDECKSDDFIYEINKMHYAKLNQERISLFKRLLEESVWVNKIYKEQIYGKK